MQVRPTRSDDIPSLMNVLDDTGLFPSEMLGEMFAPYLANPVGEEIWVTCEAGGRPIGFCYAAQEKLTDGTWNMLAIAVHSSQQTKGIGRYLVEYLEADLLKRGQRVLIADTSGTPDFAGVRDFYRKKGFTEEAQIRDFWAEGDDKVTFWKRLQTPLDRPHTTSL